VRITIIDNSYFIAATGEQSRLKGSSISVKMNNISKLQIDPSECLNSTSMAETDFTVLNGEKLSVYLGHF